MGRIMAANTVSDHDLPPSVARMKEGEAEGESEKPCPGCESSVADMLA